MFKKSISALLVLCMLFALAGCGVLNQNNSSEGYTQIASGESGEKISAKTAVNPLTGLSDISASIVDNRPVAVMVNNVTAAWSVQKGLSSADIVYETYAEGGVTRLMAVYKDITKAKDIGTVRSARYVYVDLASGHDAIYVHCGLDPNYCKARIAQIGMDDFDINTGKAADYGFRVKNGKAYEHTMYTSGAKIAEGIAKLGKRTKAKTTAFASFNDENSPVTPDGGACEKLTVPMNGKTYCSTFTYNASTGKYLKTQGGQKHIDYQNNQQIAVKNILVLYTSVGTYPDKKHMDIGLSGGSGYYISNGGYQEINWKKGTTASNPLTFTTTDGQELKLNAGNSWIFLTKNDLKSSIVFEGGAADATSSVN